MSSEVPSHSPHHEVKSLSQAWQQLKKMKQYCSSVPSPEVPIKTANICKTIRESVYSNKIADTWKLNIISVIFKMKRGFEQ